MIDGIIGAGKTELTKALAAVKGWNAVFEPMAPETQQLLDGFYSVLRGEKPNQGEPLNFQLYMLNQRYRDHMRIAYSNQPSIQDRSIWGDNVFAKMLTDDGMIREHEYRQVYLKIFESMSMNLVAPSIVFFLKVSPEVALERIRSRGRSFEHDITLEYLERLDDEYETWLKRMENFTHVHRFNYDSKPLNSHTVTEIASIIDEVHSHNHDRHLIKNII